MTPLADKASRKYWFVSYYRGVGTRVIRNRRKEAWTLAAIMIAVGLPVILIGALAAVDARIDLSDWKPGVRGTAIIGWPDLPTRAGSQVEMLGYMMDEDPSSRVFILTPEAGQFLHPAHRIPEEMIEVHLAEPGRFQYRRLVWVSGVLTFTSGPPRPDRALYALKNAILQPAPETDIPRFFRP
jgi:hypothetical protein